MKKALLFLGLVGMLPVVVLAQSASVHCPDITRTLSSGSRGEQVTELQLFLVDYFDLDPTESVTGYFGRLTRANVQKFQCQKMGLCSGDESSNGYGQAGPATRAKISAACSQTGGTAPEITGPSNSSAPIVPALESSGQQNSCPYFFPPACAGGTLVSDGVDGYGCSMGMHCLYMSTTSAPCADESCAQLGDTAVGASCTLGTATIRNGQSYTFYSLPLAPDCSHVSQSRQCVQGVLSGDSQYIFASCAQ